MGHQVFRFATLGVVVLGTAVACSAPSPTAEPVAPVIAATEGAPSPASAAKLGQFIGRFDSATNNFVIERNGPPIVLDDNLKPLSADQLPSNFGSGSTTPNTVDLVTTAVSDPYDGGTANKTFSATVQVRSFYTRALPNVWVYISAIDFPAGTPISGYNATNSDATTAITTALGINAAHGLWSYNNGSTNGLFLSANPTASNTCTPGSTLWCASRDWTFHNPANQNVVYTIEVYASYGFSKYSQGNSSLSYVEVCPPPYSTGTGTAQGNKETDNIALPFDFSLYNTNFTSINIYRDGQIVPSSTPIDITETSHALPYTTAPEPVFFAFWDRLASSTSDNSQECTATIGTAPNRQFIVEWHNYDFNVSPDGPNKGASLNFEAVLYEGSYDIHAVYGSMVGATTGGTAGRETGSKATIGMQNESGTVSTSEHNLNKGNTYGTGDAYKYTGTP